MTSVSETTRTLRYELRSREIYIEEPITSPELLSEHPQTQEESIRSIHETPNSQFRLVLSVTPCVPRISSLESVNDNTSPLLFSSTSSLTFVPTPDSPKDQPPPSPTSSTSSLTSFHTCNTSSQHNTLSPELFSPTPTSQNKWPSPPPLPQRSPRIRRHHLHNYASLASTNRSQEKRNSVGAPPLDYLTSDDSGAVRKGGRGPRIVYHVSRVEGRKRGLNWVYADCQPHTHSCIIDTTLTNETS